MSEILGSGGIGRYPDAFSLRNYPAPSKLQRLSNPYQPAKKVTLALFGGLSQHDRKAGFRVYARPFLPYFK